MQRPVHEEEQARGNSPKKLKEEPVAKKEPTYRMETVTAVGPSCLL